MDSWQLGPAPGDLWDTIMTGVSQCHAQSTCFGSSKSSLSDGTGFRAAHTVSQLVLTQSGTQPTSRSKPTSARPVSRIMAWKRHNLSEIFGRRGLLLRDLIAAAAVSLAIFWSAGGWLDQGQMLTAGKTITGAVSTYTRVTDMAVDRATATAGEYTRKIFFSEEIFQ
ncbi:hypothetical protein [Desulfoscipio gibsoniae]|uniref:hypothetical protein n=1 Tax=Desulfoscipio gibsoniae TaxID=102134 RepID=UPI00138ADFF6|nr:hypothetical protein [Desulfoscipio gibsoniae]